MKTFYRKLKRLIHLIETGRVFKFYIARIYIIEYQKRGLPHVYILIFYLDRHVFSTIEQIDNLILAELLNTELDRDRKLTQIIKSMIVYGPYKYAKSKTICIVVKKPGSPKTYNKRYSRPFHDTTTIEDNGYPTYRRRRVMDGVEVKWGPGDVFNNC